MDRKHQYKERRCKECGETFMGHFTKSGAVNGSIFMAVYDEQALFCSMRCAAEYGLRKAKEESAK